MSFCRYLGSINNDLLAYKGPWKRTVPTGSKVVHCKLEAQGKYLGDEDFITRWCIELFRIMKANQRNILQ